VQRLNIVTSIGRDNVGVSWFLRDKVDQFMSKYTNFEKIYWEEQFCVPLSFQRVSQQKYLTWASASRRPAQPFSSPFHTTLLSLQILIQC
jgi:hypothetical protein